MRYTNEYYLKRAHGLAKAMVKELLEIREMDSAAASILRQMYTIEDKLWQLTTKEDTNGKPV